jgi:hypothetical protein
LTSHQAVYDAPLATPAVHASGAQASFERVPSPDISDLTNRLQGTYAAGEDDVWAVGSSGGDDEETLIEHWDGTLVSVVPSPQQDGLNEELVAVDGTGPEDIWAVGSAGEIIGGTRTLVQHWDGAEWSIVPSPNLGFDADHTTLTDVAAIAPDDAWAVGTFQTADYPYTREPVVLHWDGTEWASVDTECEPGLDGLSANGATDLWAVGADFACHYDGTTWTPTRAATDPVPSRNVNLLDVATIGEKDAWGVGYVSIPCGENVCANGEIQRWDGARWSRVAEVPDVWVTSVHVVSATDAWATTTTGLLHYDGTGWTEVEVPAGQLAGVTSAGAGTVWAVGSTSATGSPSSTVVLRGGAA